MGSFILKRFDDRVNSAICIPAEMTSVSHDGAPIMVIYGRKLLQHLSTDFVKLLAQTRARSVDRPG